MRWLFALLIVQLFPSGGEAKLSLTWTDQSNNENSFRVERRIGTTGTFTEIGVTAANVAQYDDVTVTPGTSYCFQVKARNTVGDSGYSNIACAVAPSTQPPTTMVSMQPCVITPPPPQPTGPVASYPFSEGAGAITADSSGNGFTATLTNGTAWTITGKYGNAISFDGVNDKVTLPNTLDIADFPFTLEAWIRPTSFADWRAIFSKRASYSISQMRFDVGLSISTGRIYITNGSTFSQFTYVPPLNTWTHIAIVVESSGVKLYINGTLQQTIGAMALGSSASAPVAIGNTGDNDDPFAGQIDNLRLYTRALSQTEIQSAMNMP